jgi:hypothetical protein
MVNYFQRDGGKEPILAREKGKGTLTFSAKTTINHDFG